MVLDHMSISIASQLFQVFSKQGVLTMFEKALSGCRCCCCHTVHSAVGRLQLKLDIRLRQFTDSMNQGLGDISPLDLKDVDGTGKRERLRGGSRR